MKILNKRDGGPLESIKGVTNEEIIRDIVKILMRYKNDKISCEISFTEHLGSIEIDTSYSVSFIYGGQIKHISWDDLCDEEDVNSMIDKLLKN